MLRTSVLAFLATNGLLVIAQEPDGTLPPQASRLGHPQGVFRCDGELVAIGGNFKAYFGPTGVEFVPAFGRQAPRNYPLGLRAIGMGRGGVEVQFAGAPPEQVGAATVRFARAPGVVETFTALADGLEQSFVLAARPQGSGDLVVRCELQCEVPARADDAGGIVFAVPGVGSFAIGAVTGIDAAGRRVRGGLRLDGTMLAMSLPADFVDCAEYPLVLDPLLGGPVLMSLSQLHDPDVTRDPATGDWLAVWTSYASAQDGDVYARRIAQATGNPVGAAFVVDASTTSTEYPRAGSVRQSGRVLVVYRTPGGILSAPEVRGRIVQVSTSTASLAASIGYTGSQVRFAVGSEDTTADNEALVCWSNSSDVLVAEVTVGTSGAPVPAAPVAVATGQNNAICTISKTNGGTGNYLVAWRSSALLGTTSTLYGVLVSRNVAVLTPVRTLDAAATGYPAVDCSGSRYLVTYAKWEPNSQVHRDVMCVAVAHLTPFNSIIVIDGPLPVEATSGQDESGPDVAWLGQRFGVTFTENAGAANENLGAWLVNPDCTNCSTRMTLTGVTATGYTQERQARIAGRAPWVAGAVDGEILFVQDNPTTQMPLVVSQRVLSVGPGGAVTDLGGGCGQGGSVAAVQSGFALGNAGFRFEVAGLASGAVPVCCLALPGPTQTCGSCTFLNPLAAFFETNTAGVASHAFTVPCDPLYIGLPLEVQWASLLTTTTPCPSLAGLAVSNRVRYAIGP
ncbi:MAG: hypothetical protein U1E73_06890 [Planctomycetota bacterium]